MSDHTLNIRLDPEAVDCFIERASDKIRAQVAPILDQRLLFAHTIVRLVEQRRKPFDLSCRACCLDAGAYADDSASFVCAYHQAKQLLEQS